jgi:hypothetical protein
MMMTMMMMMMTMMMMMMMMWADEDVQFWRESQRERDRREDLKVGEMIMFKWILE